MLRALVCASLLSLSSLASAQAPFDPATLERAAALRDSARASNGAYALVRELTTEVGPRFAGSDADRAAVVRAINLLKRLGFHNVRSEPVRVPQWLRGEVRVGFAGEAPFTALALGGSSPTQGGPVSAPVLRVTSIEALDALPPEAVAGRIVFFDSRMERTRDGSGYGRAVVVRGRGTTLAAAKGAVAVVIRSVGTSSEDVAHTGSMRYQDKFAPAPSVALSNVSADRLAAMLAATPDRPLEVFVGSVWKEDATSANVIGEFPGASDDVVLLGAHLDSWDVGFGANDDAAGVAIVAEAARLAAAAGGLKRTLRVVLYANEEFGVSGGRAYATAYAASIDKHALVMEADFGSGAVWALTSKVADSALPIADAVASVLAPLGVERGGNAAYGGTDIEPLMSLGVPALGPHQDGSLYFDVHHSHADTLERIDRNGLSQNVAVYAVCAFLAAQDGVEFGRIPVAPAGTGH